MQRSKQNFRPQPPADEPPRGPRYPTLEVGRRRFLRRFGVVASGALGLLVVGCTNADAGGSPQMPNVDWRRDVRRPDAGPADMVDADTVDAEMMDAGIVDADSSDADTRDNQ